jgi:transcriptional regulator with XRE-family HTH domain
MTISFDMHRIGQTIASLRREHNMTQMALADAMGVSFQAVSNWERGQSMPDISKLPELAELFGTTIDALLGRHSPLIEKVAEGKLEELPSLTVEEVAEAAPILPPQQMDALTDKLLQLSNFPDMEELLPFLSTGKVDEIARARMQAGLGIDELLPFMSEDCVDEIARIRAQSGLSIDELLPFLYEDSVDELARQLNAAGHSIDELLPFMSENTLVEIALSRLQQERSITSLLPFVGERLLNRLAEAASTKD